MPPQYAALKKDRYSEWSGGKVSRRGRIGMEGIRRDEKPAKVLVIDSNFPSFPSLCILSRRKTNLDLLLLEPLPDCIFVFAVVSATYLRYVLKKSGLFQAPPNHATPGVDATDRAREHIEQSIENSAGKRICSCLWPPTCG